VLTLLVAAGLVGGCGSRDAKEQHGREGHDDHGKEESHDDHGKEEGTEEKGHDEHGAEGLVELTPEQVATAKIVSVTAERRPVSSEVVATAEIVPPDDGIARIGGKAAGRISKLAAGVGDQVRKGQVIAMIDSPELGRAKADYLAAAAGARVGRETADREKALFDKRISSERDYRLAEAEATKARAEKEAAEARLHTLGLSEGQVARLSADQHSSSTVSVSTPIAGVVVERPVTLGQMIEPQDTVAVIMDLRSVWMQVDVYERDLSQLTIGQQVAARVGAWREREFTGEIHSIGAIVDRRSRTVKVRVVIANADGALKPGMFAQVTLAGSQGEPRDGLFVPASAVQRDGDAWLVFVPVSDHEFQVREVETGVTTADWIEVTRGLVAGERVVTVGTFQLKSEARRESFGGHEH
jgi:cobalt-zinc-cadmium efflux system membrane fusion protein